MFIHIAQNCAKFDCSYVGKKKAEEGAISAAGGIDSDAVAKDCPKAKILMILLPDQPDLKPGPVKVDLDVSEEENPTSITNGLADGGNITEVTDKEIKGTLDLKSGVGNTLPNAAASGTFTATICR